MVFSLPEDTGIEEDEEAGGESTGVTCTTAAADGVVETAEGVMTEEGAVVTVAVK